MYNEHIFCEEYDELKSIVEDVLNGDDTETSPEDLANRIQEIYDDGKMPSSQYDELMGYIQDM